MIVLLLLLGTTVVQSCCPTCNCHRTCHPPSIAANISLNGIEIFCPDSTCACVKDELDTCTYGGTWVGQSLITWSDARWHECIKVTHTDPLQASAIIRWWDNAAKCMGHSILNVETQLLPVHRDVMVDFEQTILHTHDETINNAFYVRATSGCDDPRPIVGQSEMFFQIVMDPPQMGAHLQLTTCSVITTAGACDILDEECEVNTIPLSTDGAGPHTGLFSRNNTRLTYTAFWDDATNSPYHNIQCNYAVFNGSYLSERSYMIADPDEHGVLWHEH